MLKDQDRIFTNLYGMHDRTLKGAMARGHWDGTSKIIQNGRDWIIDQMNWMRLNRVGLRMRFKNWGLTMWLLHPLTAMI